ncbi:MAG: M48 family metallopeptidase [Candidatus Margulisiibacteriota bacterium]
MPSLETSWHKHVSIQKIRGRKSLSLRVEGPDRIVVRSPWLVSPKTIWQFIYEKSDWIQDRLDDHAARHRPLTTGRELLYLGQPKTLQIVPSPKKRPVVTLAQDTLRVATQHPETVKAALEKWYRANAADIISDRVSIFQPQVGKPVNAIRFKTLKSRWGSCSSKNNLNFNWTLMMAPLDVIDYVVVHELCHLLVPNHSAAFWETVAKILPDYKQRWAWLKNNGEKLRL